MADIETVRRHALALPEVTEGTWFRTPAWRVRKKSFARLKEDGETLVVRVDWREMAPRKLVEQRDAAKSFQ